MGLRGFENELAARRGEVKTDENDALHYFKVSLEKGYHTGREPMKTKSANKHVRTATENQKENSRLVSAFSFSS